MVATSRYAERLAHALIVTVMMTSSHRIRGSFDAVLGCARRHRFAAGSNHGAIATPMQCEQSPGLCSDGALGSRCVRSLWTRLAVVARLTIVIALIVSTTGVMHLGAEALADETEIDTDCDPNCADAGTKCPPICPTCACAHSPRVSLPPNHLSSRVIQSVIEVAYVSMSTLKLPSPEPRTIFHPPRA